MTRGIVRKYFELLERNGRIANFGICFDSAPFPKEAVDTVVGDWS